MIEHANESCECPGKTCTKCSGLLCVGMFNRDNRLCSGLAAECKICAKQRNKRWREENREYDRVRHQKYVEANKEKVNDRRRRYYKHNMDKMRAHAAKWREEHPGYDARWHSRWKEAHPDGYREKRKIYRETHKEILRRANRRYQIKNAELRRQRAAKRRENPEVKARIKAYRETNKERFSLRFKQYYYENREWMGERKKAWLRKNRRRHASYQARRRTRKTLAGGSYTVQEWDTLKSKYNSTCLCCGKQEPEIKLTADHIIPVVKGGHSSIDNIQPLCRSCNSSKGTKVIDFRPHNP